VKEYGFFESNESLCTISDFDGSKLEVIGVYVKKNKD
jgi:hypothetical protein